MIAGALATPGSEDAAIIVTAAIRAAKRLDIPGRVLANIIGVSEPTVTRMKKGEFALDRDRNAFQLAVLFVRLYRSLDAIVGGDASVAAAWFKNYNTVLDARPVDVVQSIAGLTHVIDYLDSRRAPL